jgi:hypothetical protein
LQERFVSSVNDGAAEQNVSNWAAILGRWRFDDGGRAVYDGPQKPEWPFGICVSNVRFSEGEARVTVQQNSGSVDGRLLLGYRSPTVDYFAIGLGGYGNAYTMTHFNAAIGWRNIASAGRTDNLVAGRPYELCVRVHGQRIALEVDGVRVLEHLLEAPLPYGQLGLFAWGELGGTEFTKMSVRKNPPEVFVVMQFSGFEELYADVIRPITKEFGLEPYRADEVFGPGNIIEDIIHGIELAQIIIAEITPPNENVFYEVGYAHALKKPTILLADRTKKLPFDLSGRRCLFYENSIGGKRRVEEGLRRHLQAILDE